MTDRKETMEMRGKYLAKARGGAALAALVLVTGCQKHQATGQILAVINGQDVTRRDFAADLAAANTPGNVDLKVVQPAVMSDLVNRKLLVEQAKQQGLQKNPDYLAAAARAQEVVLAQQLVSTWTSKLPPPTAQDVQSFIVANPQMFDRRQLYLLDQIQTEAKGLDPTSLAPLHSLDAVAEYLRQQNHPFRRGNATLDTLTVPAENAQKIAQLAPGEPFVSNRGTALEIDAMLQVKAAPIAEAQRYAVASQALRQHNVQKAIADHIKSLRAAATITYQAGFAPPQRDEQS